MHPAFWPMQAFVFWADVLMLPWKMMMAPVADSLNVAAAATSPACVYRKPKPCGSGDEVHPGWQVT
jgi:hypothetical protein